MDDGDHFGPVGAHRDGAIVCRGRQTRQSGERDGRDLHGGAARAPSIGDDRRHRAGARRQLRERDGKRRRRRRGYHAGGAVGERHEVGRGVGSLEIGPRDEQGVAGDLRDFLLFLEKVIFCCC